MGAGIALECRYRHPKMFEQYAKLCSEGKLDVGLLWIYKSPEQWILNFPTKKHWKDVSRPEFLHAGLKKFLDTYQQRQIESIAFPLLGAQNGGLTQQQSLEIMLQHLRHCQIPVEIYRYDPKAPDDKYDAFRTAFLSMSDEEIKHAAGIRIDIARKIRDALYNDRICQLNQLASVNGVGDKSLEAVFRYVSDNAGGPKTMQNQLLI